MYYTASGIVTLVGGRPVHRLREKEEEEEEEKEGEEEEIFSQHVNGTATYRLDDTRCCIIQF